MGDLVLANGENSTLGCQRVSGRGASRRARNGAVADTSLVVVAAATNASVHERPFEVNCTLVVVPPRHPTQKRPSGVRGYYDQRRTHADRTPDCRCAGVGPHLDPWVEAGLIADMVTVSHSFN